MPQKRKIIEIDEELCNGCGECVPACEEGAIEVVDGKARLVADKYCDGLGNCLGECPTGALRIVEREAEAFDQEAVQELLARKEQQPSEQAGGCPSARLQRFSPCEAANRPSEQAESALSHWPVQIKLVPPHAPFLKGAEILVAADCAPVASAEFHSRFLPGRVVLLGCPKFDEVEAYVQKFQDIFEQAGPRSVTVLSMEVPCCSGLLGLVKKAKELAGSDVSVDNVVLSTRGQVMQELKNAA